MDFTSAMQSERHGFVVEIGPDTNPNYFTGCGYSVFLKDAKVFRTSRGAMCASRIWQEADYGRPIPQAWFEQRRVRGVALKLEMV